MTDVSKGQPNDPAVSSPTLPGRPHSEKAPMLCLQVRVSGMFRFSGIRVAHLLLMLRAAALRLELARAQQVEQEVDEVGQGVRGLM